MIIISDINYNFINIIKAINSITVKIKTSQGKGRWTPCPGSL